MADIGVFTEELVFDGKRGSDKRPVAIAFILIRRILSNKDPGNGPDALLKIRIVLGNMEIIQVVIIPDGIDIDTDRNDGQDADKDQVTDSVGNTLFWSAE